MSTKELKHLLRVLKERDIALGYDDVAWAFESSDTQESAANWVNEYLSPSTLLTREELNFYERQEKVSAPEGADSGRPLTDDEFEAAILSLEASTKAIENQCQVLEAQKQSLSEFKSRHAGGNDSEQANSRRSKKLEREKAQLDFEIDELSESLQSRLRASITQTDATTAGLPAGIERMLEKDDRLLDGLENLLPRLADDNDNSETDLADVEKLCDALTMLSGQSVRLNIDAAYREGTRARSLQANGHNEKRPSEQTAKQCESLGVEIDELTGEIDGLITMAVDSQFRVPILKGLRADKAAAEQEKARWSSYIIATMKYLTSRLERLTEHVDHLHTHQNALKSISSALESSMLTETAKVSNQANPTVPAPNSQKGLKPLRLVQANLSESQDPVAQLLRHFDIRGADPSDVSKLGEILNQVTTERQKKLAELSRSTESLVSDQIADSLSKADRNVMYLLEAVYAHSKFGSVKLVDEEVQEGLQALEEKTQALGAEMRELDVHEIAETIKKKHKDLFNSQ